ncbi:MULTISPECIES: TfoX/Sxy family protein [Spongiibacter]|uniref:TfoX/Sxy family protein n=1 Tax=Spongiibacter TaxID=630749 RepID=UPI00235433CF|nr:MULTISPECIES: TfoX/Sxy family protein [Spongiibacter]
MGAADQEFTEYVLDLMQVVGPVTARRMFGGYGLFLDGLMIALIIKRVLYLKADALSKDDFVSEGLAAFEYHKQGKPYTLSYYEAPETVFDDLDAMHKWGNNAYGAALRAAAKKARKRG